ncbi:MAG: SRPBCC family protein [Elusimicrobia bacterium]|nr:SRPBCC family protein [Elusimicrobiota bacterium]
MLDKEQVSVGRVERWAFWTGGGLLVLYGLTRRSFSGTLNALLGAGLIYRGAMWHRHSHAALGARKTTRGIRISEEIMVHKSPEELYRFWATLENLPRIISHLESVRRIDERHSHWAAKGPAGVRVEWDAEIVRHVENELISWQSLETADVYNAGSVSFRKLPHEPGTRVKVVLRYDPPGGRVTSLLAKFFREDPAQQVRDDLQRFKLMMESEEILMAAKGSPSTLAESKADRLPADADPARTPPF